MQRFLPQPGESIIKFIDYHFYLIFSLINIKGGKVAKRGGAGGRGGGGRGRGGFGYTYLF